MGIIADFLDRVVVRSDFRFEDVVLAADRLAWVNDSADNSLGDYPGPGWQEDGPLPTWDAEPFEPEGIAAAYWLGFELGRAGEYPKPPSHFTEREAYHFNCGRLAGFIESEDGRAWHADMEAMAEERRMEAAFAEFDAWHDAEVVQAVGVIEARKGGAR